MTIGFYKWDLTKKIWPLKSGLRSDEVFDHRNDGRSFGASSPFIPSTHIIYNIITLLMVHITNTTYIYIYIILEYIIFEYTIYHLHTHNWLVVSTPLKNISQLGLLFPIYGKIKFMFQTTNQITLYNIIIVNEYMCQ